MPVTPEAAHELHGNFFGILNQPRGGYGLVMKHGSNVRAVGLPQSQGSRRRCTWFAPLPPGMTLVVGLEAMVVSPSCGIRSTSTITSAFTEPTTKIDRFEDSELTERLEALRSPA